MSLSPETVATVRPFVPLLRELRAAGFQHQVFGGVVYDETEHYWQRGGPWDRTYLELESGGFRASHITRVEAEEWKVRVSERLTPNRVRVVLAAYGLVSHGTQATCS